MRNNQATKYLWITLFILGIFAILPKAVSAAVIVGQYNGSTASNQAIAWVQFQGCYQGQIKIGNGYTASPVSVTYFGQVSSSLSSPMQTDLVPYNDSGYTSPYYAGVQNFFTSSTIGTGLQQITSINSSPVAMDASKYYLISIRGKCNNNPDFYVIGDTIGSTYPYSYDHSSSPFIPPVNGYSADSAITTAVFELSGDATYSGGIPPDTSTRFISPLLPTASSTVATSTPVSIGSHVYVKPDDYVAGKTYLRMSFTNYTASLVTGSALQAWDTAFNNIEIPITASSTDLDISTTTDKFNIYLGKTEGNYQIVVKDCPWYGFGLFCTTDSLVASSTYFYIGQKTGFDIDQEAGNLGIFGLAPGSDPFVSTTTNAVLDCDIAVSFELDKCLWSFVIPNPYLTKQVLGNYKSLPILGWPIRFVEIFITTTATTSLPVINYTFAAHNSFVGGVNIHFNPWQYMFTSGSLVKDAWVADDGSGNIWDIMGPFVKLVVYMTLMFYIIRRLTGLNWGGEYTTTETGSETVSSSERLPDGARKTFTHSITKRRRL